MFFLSIFPQINLPNSLSSLTKLYVYLTHAWSEMCLRYVQLKIIVKLLKTVHFSTIYKKFVNRSADRLDERLSKLVEVRSQLLQASLVFFDLN